MRNLYAWLAAGILGVNSLFGGCCQPIWTYYPEYEQPSFTVDFGCGYRQDQLQWSIAGPCDTPDTISLVHWKELNILQGYTQARYVSCHNYYTRFTGAYGQIHKGHNRDSDYRCDDRRGETLRIEAKAGKGSVYDLEGCFGYQWTSDGRRAIVTPVAGYSFHRQTLHMYNGEVEINRIAPELVGSIPNLHSTYKTKWQGLFLGVDWSVLVECNVTLFGTLEFHWKQYRAQGCWNLREDFLTDLKHRAHGRGVYASLGANYNFCCNWSFGVITMYRNMKTKDGKHRVKVLLEQPELLTGGTVLAPFPLSLELHAVRWSSFGVVGELTYRW